MININTNVLEKSNDKSIEALIYSSYPVKSGDIFSTPGGQLLIAIAPCCPIFNPCQLNPKSQPQILAAKFWMTVNGQMRQVAINDCFPTWVVRVYEGGNLKSYSPKGEAITLWWVKNQLALSPYLIEEEYYARSA
jgi:hypothetical protein